MGSTSEQDQPVSVQLGSLQVQGFVKKETQVANYLGLQYATIPARFRQSQPVHHSSLTGVLDATLYGPRCPQVDRPGDSPLFEGVRRSSEYPTDEFGCLRLNVYTPPAPAHELLPVLVWIHGGGFVFGDGNSEFDGNFLVRHSIDSGKPIIYVAINYRLGYFGFLTSKELQDEARGAGEVEFVNMALYDQRVALLWVQKNIQHFGGDPANVTIAGESAGGLSVLAHLRSDVPVCQRGMIMSSPNLDYPRPEEAQFTFDSLVASTGLSPSAPAEEKLAALRALPTADILKLLGSKFSTPLWDPKWFVYQDGSVPTAGPAPLAPWVKGLVTGSTKDEAAVFLFHLGLSSWVFNQFEDHVRSVVPDEKDATALMKVYNISSAASPKVNLRGYIDMVTDCNFSGLPYIVAEQAGNASSPPISIYRFEQADGFAQSPLKGYAYHALDNAFFCRLPSVAGPRAQPDTRETADRLSRAVLDFAHGSQPWETYDVNRRIMVFNGDASGLVSNEQGDRWQQLFGARDREKPIRRLGHKLMGLGHDSLP